MEQQDRTDINRRQFMQSMALAGWAGRALPALQTATGLKATWLNHYTYVAPDLKKTRDWYQEVFGMQIGHEEATLSHMWYGDKGDTLMIVRQAASGEQAPRIDRFGFTLQEWDRKAVEAELKRRGLQPKADTDKGFWFADPEGNEIGVFAGDYVKDPR